MDVDARIDTAYDGASTVPPAVVAALNLAYLTTIQATLADGNRVAIPVYEAVVLWDGTPRTIEVECTAGHCLLGTGLLQGHDLRVRFVSGGNIEIEAIP
jgi:clan AA aspartic protease